MSNPMNCATCDYKYIPHDSGGWCYMFRNEPTSRCARHTGKERRKEEIADRLLDEWLSEGPDMNEEGYK